MFVLSIIRKTSECPELPARVRMGNAETLFGLCWGKLADIRQYIADGQHNAWVCMGESMVIHNQQTGKIKEIIPG